MTDRRRFTTLLASALAASALPARAQTFPARPVTIIVPFAAGGAVDIVARTIADRLAQRWGQQPVIENRPAPAASSPRRRWCARRPMATR